jgi:hypothetical protein
MRDGAVPAVEDDSLQNLTFQSIEETRYGITKGEW